MGKYIDKRKAIFQPVFIRILCLFGLLLGATLWSSNALVAQEYYGKRSNSTPPAPTKSNGGFQWDRLVIGGNLGAQFGTVTLVEVSPNIGYLVNDNFLAGVGGTYIYFEDSRPPVYKTNIWGQRVFTQVYIAENFIAHTEYELLNVDDRFDIDRRVFVSSLFVGGGYRSVLGGNSFASVLLLYNLLDDVNSPYTNPVIRVGFGVGF